MSSSTSSWPVSGSKTGRLPPSRGSAAARGASSTAARIPRKAARAPPTAVRSSGGALPRRAARARRGGAALPRRGPPRRASGRPRSRRSRPGRPRVPVLRQGDVLVGRRQRRLERLVELVGEPLFVEEVEFGRFFLGRRVAGHLGVGAAGVERRLLVELGRRAGGLLRRGGGRGLRLALGGVDQLLVGGALLLGGRGGLGGGDLRLHVEHLRRLVGDRVALVGVGAGVGDDLVLGDVLLAVGAPGPRRRAEPRRRARRRRGASGRRRSLVGGGGTWAAVDGGEAARRRRRSGSAAARRGRGKLFVGVEQRGGVGTGRRAPRSRRSARRSPPSPVRPAEPPADR